MPKTAITKGTTFRATYHDGKPTWKVVKARGKDTWECIVVEDADWAGAKRVFGGEEIRAAIRIDAFFDSMVTSDDKLWDRQRLGSILHYDNSFGEYVRGKVVIADAGEYKGKKVLLPLALVGNWEGRDLPRRGADGSIEQGYHAKKIANGDAWRPSMSCVWENTQKVGRRINKPDIIDPRPLKAISLKAPPLPLADRKIAAREKYRSEIVARLTDWKDPATLEQVAEMFKPATMRTRIAELAKAIS